MHEPGDGLCVLLELGEERAARRVAEQAGRSTRERQR
jgi:hypothetical protein